LLSPEEIREIEEEAAKLPQRASASIEALKIVQRRRGWITDEAIRDIAERLGMSAEELDGVATFYNLIYRRPVGRHVILVCDSVSCWIMGSNKIFRELRERLGIEPGGTTADGRFTVVPNACLGICERAPALMVGEDLHTDLEPGTLDRILERYR